MKTKVEPDSIVFDSQMLIHGSQGGGIDTTRFERADLIYAGRYRLDLLINGNWRGVQNIELRNVPGQENAQLCYDRCAWNIIRHAFTVQSFWQWYPSGSTTNQVDTHALKQGPVITKLRIGQD